MPDRGLDHKFEELKKYVDWSDVDAERVTAVRELVIPHLEPLVEDFYRSIAECSNTRLVMQRHGDPAQRLKVSLHAWLKDVFTGPYDDTYAARRWRIGMRHVEIGLEQIFVNAAFSRLSRGLRQTITTHWNQGKTSVVPTLESLSKLLDMDLALVQDAYETAHLAEQCEAERRRGDAVFRDLVDSASCLIVIVSPEGKIRFVNSFAEQLTGKSANEIHDADLFETLLPKESHEAIRSSIGTALLRGKVESLQSPILNGDSMTRNVLWNLRLLESYRDASAVLLIGHDISDLVSAQEKAIQSERLATIGSMSTSMAHESRNALQRIQACSEMLELEVSSNSEAVALIKRIQQAQEQLLRLFDEIKNYAAPLRLDISESKLRGAWREAWEILEHFRNGRAARLIEDVHDEDTLPIDRYRMIQLFRNLFENSLNACADPVEIAIQCERINRGVVPHVRVTIRDNGPGLTPEQRQRVFEPFFTTKAQGTGLGMPIASRIAQEHGGSLLVGRQGTGAEFVLLLPVRRPHP